MNDVRNGNLINYIRFVKNLEVSVYEQEMVLDSLNRKIVRTYSGEKHKERVKAESFGDLLFHDCICSVTIMVLIGAIIAFTCAYEFGGIISALFLGGPLFGAVWKGIKIGFIVGIALGILIAFIRWTKNSVEVKKQNREIDQYNAEIVKTDQANIRAFEERNKLVTAEFNLVQNNLNKTKKMLASIYDMNIIHKKYRYNLVYICSIYEYFDTGRCNKLDGHEGAYNLLEQDIKYQMIMDKLDVIIRKLDDIKDSQRELYIAISNTNRNIQQVNSAINHLSGSMNNMQDNLNSIEYNSRISRQNGEFLKWYAYFRN